MTEPSNPFGERSRDKSNSNRPLDYHELGQAFSAPVSVRQLPNAKLLWLNQAWFDCQGFDSGDANRNTQLKAWLERAYGVCTLELSGEPVAPRRSDHLLYYADRYGGTGGAPHGGSGRCIHHSGLNAKGVGPTPLVPEDVPFAYRHGFLQLSQAIKQTVMSVAAQPVQRSSCAASETVRWKRRQQPCPPLKAFASCDADCCFNSIIARKKKIAVALFIAKRPSHGEPLIRRPT